MPPDRRILVRLLVLCAGLGLASSPDAVVLAQESTRATTTATPRLNIVVLVADDHGQDTGAYGNTAVRTPHLDALAAEGVRFRHAYATTASCSASRSVLLTGLHNHRTAQYGHEHDYSHFQSYPGLRPLPVLLQDAGYRTARIGKFHVAPADTYRFELYDLAQDPHESRNLARDPAHAATLAAYTRKLRAFQERTSDPWVLKWSYQ